MAQCSITPDAARHERFRQFVYDREVVFSLLLLAVEQDPDYANPEMFKQCTFDTLESCPMHRSVCHPVNYWHRGLELQTYRCKNCENEGFGFSRVSPTGLEPEYGSYYKRRMRILSGDGSKLQPGL